MVEQMQAVQTAIAMSSTEFAQGYHEGWAGYDIRGFPLHLQPDENTIVELIRTFAR